MESGELARLQSEDGGWWEQSVSQCGRECECTCGEASVGEHINHYHTSEYILRLHVASGGLCIYISLLKNGGKVRPFIDFKSKPKT